MEHNTMTLLEIYDQYLNGNKATFINEVTEYGLSNFLMDIIEECKEGVLDFDEIYKMKNTIKAIKSYDGMKAHSELHRIKSLSAFNVQGYTEKIKVNQNLTRYYFDDASRLDLYPSRSEGVAFDQGKRIATCFLKINK
jgi:hypothetical protein